MKSMMTGRVPIPADQTAIPYGTDTSSPTDFLFIVIISSETFTTLKPVSTSMPSLWNFASANAAILSSNLYNRNRDSAHGKHERDKKKLVEVTSDMDFESATVFLFSTFHPV
jgi:hypothetical protein